jgi:hypothetical protein
MSRHALTEFEQELRAKRTSRPPRLSDYRGRKENQFRRRVIYEHDLRHWLKTRANGRGMTQEERDRRELGSFRPWISQARAEAAAVRSAAKFQAAARAHP